MDAARLLALWKARRTYGPKGRWSRLDLHTELGPRCATFKAFIEAPSGGATCLLTVLIDDSGHSQSACRLILNSPRTPGRACYRAPSAAREGVSPLTPHASSYAPLSYFPSNHFPETIQPLRNLL
jgi:hypothetical protein